MTKKKTAPSKAKKSDDYYDIAIAEIKEAKKRGAAIIVYLNQGDTFSVVGKASGFDFAQLAAHIKEDEPAAFSAALDSDEESRPGFFSRLFGAK